MGVRQIAMHNYNKEVFTAKRKALRKSFPAIEYFNLPLSMSKDSPLFDTVPI